MHLYDESVLEKSRSLVNTNKKHVIFKYCQQIIQKWCSGLEQKPFGLPIPGWVCEWSDVVRIPKNIRRIVEKGQQKVEIGCRRLLIAFCQKRELLDYGHLILINMLKFNQVLIVQHIFSICSNIFSYVSSPFFFSSSIISSIYFVMSSSYSIIFSSSSPIRFRYASNCSSSTSS